MRFLSKFRMGLVLIWLTVPVLGILLNGEGDTPAASAIVAYEQEFVDVAIDIGDRISINGELVFMGNFEQEITSSIGGDPSKAVINIRCEADVTVQELSVIQDKLIAMDLVQVIYHCDEEKALPFVLPTQQTQDQLNTIPASNIVTVAIDDNGTVRFNGREVETKMIAEATRTQVAQNDKTIVTIHAQDGTRYRDFVTVLAEIKKGGARKILLGNPRV